MSWNPYYPGQGDRKISQMPSTQTLPSDSILTVVSGGVNLQIPLSIFQSGIGVTGTIESLGTGSPVLDIAGSVNRIRALEGGTGITISVGPTNNLIIAQDNFPLPVTEVIEITSDYTVIDDSKLIVCNNTTPITVTLKASPVVGDNATVVRAGTGAVTVDGNGQNIIGSATQPLSTQYDVMNVISSSVEWVLFA